MGSMRPPTTVLLFMLVSAACGVHAQTTPAKLASSARLDLNAGPNVRALARAEIPNGTGSVERMNWVPEPDRPRSYTVQFPITHLGWSEFAVRFVPEGSGPITLSLMGP